MEGTPRDAAEAPRDAERPKREAPPKDAAAREQTFSLEITSLAAVATAWSAFQASTWSGVQTFALADSARLRQQSTEARLEGDQQMHLDADLFVAYAGALVEHREDFATFLRDRFPPRLKVATAAWLDKHPLESPSAPPHPLAMPEYRVEATERAAAVQKQADVASAQAATANHNGDLYVLTTVLLALVITVSSLGAALPTQRRTTLLICAVILLGVIVSLALRPIAWVSPAG